jgi:hypothetical protein
MILRLLFFLYLAACTTKSQTTNDLPIGVPNPIGKDGRITDAIYFTTSAYQKEAFRLVLVEANQVARDLKLSEKLPIKESDVAEAFIGPFGIAYLEKAIGNITTSNYCYCVSLSNKFCYLTKNNFEEAIRNYAGSYMWPKKRMNTAEAYQMATQWLTAAKMDMKAMNRNLHLVIKPDDDYIAAPRGKFVPVYEVNWCKPWKPTPGIIEENHGKWEAVVSVQLFTPTKTLLQMHVEDPKYILRPALVFTNLAELLSTNAVAGTNAPGSP